MSPAGSLTLRWAAALLVAFFGGYLLHAAVSTPEPSSRRLAIDLANPAVSHRLGSVYTASSSPFGTTATKLPLIHVLLSDPSPNVRLAVVEILQDAGPDGDIRRALLQAALTDPSPSVRVAAVRAVAHTWPSSAPPLVEQILGQPDLEPALRPHLIRLVSQPALENHD